MIYPLQPHGVAMEAFTGEAVGLLRHHQVYAVMDLEGHRRNH